MLSYIMGHTKCRNKQLDYDVFNLEWNIKYDFDGSPEVEAINIIENNKSIHIDRI